MGATLRALLYSGHAATLPWPHYPRRGSHELLLRARHFRSLNGILVVKAMQMEKSMRDIQTQLTFD